MADAQVAAHALDQHRRHAGGAGDGGVQAGDVEVLQPRVREHGQKQRGRPGQEADAVGLDARQHRVGVEDGAGVDGGATQQRRHPAGLVAEGVEEGVDDEVAVALAQAHHARPDVEGAQGGAMRGHHALGSAGGAAGEHQVGRGVGLHARAALINLRLRHFRALGQKVSPAQVACLQHATLAQHDQAAQRARAQAVQQRGVVLAQKAAHAEQPHGTAARQDVGRLGALHAGVDGHQHPTHGMHRAGRDDPLVQIGRPKRHPLTKSHTQRQQRARGLVNALAQLGIAQGQLTVDHGGAIAVAGRGLLQHGGYGERQRGLGRPSIEVCHGGGYPGWQA